LKIGLIFAGELLYSAAFIFRPGTYDNEFHRLNKLIDAAAKETDGFLGTETWRSLDGKTLNATYYWESLEALKEFSGNANHLEAKKQYSRWYDGYHIVVSEVIRSYGDETIPHLTPNDRDTKTT
jgi:heme-degrading monooxygenase HmoA